MWDKKTFSVQQINNTKVKKSDVLLGYLILFWILLHLAYKKCLNLLLRRMCIPLIRRSRIIEAVWKCGFCYGSVCYLKLSTFKTFNFFSNERELTHEELGIILHKSFYFHQTGIEIFCHGAWTKGLANLLFASFVINPYQEKWCTVLSTFLYYKAVDTILVNLSVIFVCFSIIFRGSQLLFCIHSVNWIYLYLSFVPRFMLWPEKTTYIGPEIGLWLWFIVECKNSMWLKFSRCKRCLHWMEICLFPPPTWEALKLAGIERRRRKLLEKLVNRTSKNQLWQTILCAIFIKRKVKRYQITRNGQPFLKELSKTATAQVMVEISKPGAMFIKREVRRLHQAMQNDSVLMIVCGRQVLPDGETLRILTSKLGALVIQKEIKQILQLTQPRFSVRVFICILYIYLMFCICNALIDCPSNYAEDY